MFGGALSAGGGGADWTRFALLTLSRQVGYPSVGFASRLPDKSNVVGYRHLHLVLSREMLPTHSSRNFTINPFRAPEPLP